MAEKTTTICPHCRTDFAEVGYEQAKIAPSFIHTNPWYKGHVKTCRKKSELERAYWKHYRDWPRANVLTHLKRVGLDALVQRREQMAHKRVEL